MKHALVALALLLAFVASLRYTYRRGVISGAERGIAAYARVKRQIARLEAAR